MTVEVRRVLDVDVARALQSGALIDITTRGRHTGQLRRVELVFHVIDNRVYISGRPGRRGWYANLLANPSFVFHLKGRVVADLPAMARPITDPDERRDALAAIAAGWGYDLELMAARAPLVEVRFADGVR